MKKKVLITGALGQDGIILSKILLKNKYKVIGLIKKKNYKFKLKKVKYLSVNLGNKKKLESKLLKINPDFIVHFGSGNPSFIEREKNIIDFKKEIINSYNLINASRKLKIQPIFIFTNSSKIFKKIKNKKKLTERDQIIKNNKYASFRINVYNYLILLKKKYNFPFVNLILFNHDSSLRNKKFLLPRIINAFLKKNLIFIKNIYQQNIIEDFSHAEDICQGIFLVIKKKLTIDKLILSSGKPTKVNSLIKYLFKINNINFPFKKIKIKKTNYLFGSNCLAKKLIDWKIKKNIFDAIKEMYISYNQKYNKSLSK